MSFTYGTVLRAARRASGRTQADLARVLGVTTANVCQVEKSARGPFPPDLTRKVASYLAPHTSEALLLVCARQDPRRAARASRAAAGRFRESLGASTLRG